MSRKTGNKRRIKLASLIEFPFDKPRKGQLELVSKLEQTLEDKSQILLQAPTGLKCKTMESISRSKAVSIKRRTAFLCDAEKLSFLQFQMQ